MPTVGIEPFSIDTMNFTQWLQAVFIPRFGLLLATGQALPDKLAIYPMAEVYFLQANKDGFNAETIAPVLQIIKKIDAEFTQASQMAQKQRAGGRLK